VAVVQPDYDSSPRGRGDAARHREKIREAIRENLPDIVGEEAIITRKGKQVVRVPVRGLKSYRFVHSHGGGASGGFGSGSGKKGQVVGRRAKGGRPGQAGDRPGEDYLETEIELEELISMMLEDLGLPNLQKKEVREAEVPMGWKFESIEKTGIRPRLDKKRSIKEAIKRTEVLVGQLMHETGRSEADCRRALEETRGSLPLALERLRGIAGGESGARGPAEQPTGGEPRRVYLDSSDLRYRTLEEDVERRSNAVVLAMMDVSGSMGTMQKYLARSFYFWMISFLRTLYRHVEIRFIAHTTEARLVDEHEFFHRGESGGTFCHSAYELAAGLVDAEYPTSGWNVYPFHFSDGEDWDTARTLTAAGHLLDRGVAALGYGEIQSDYSSSVLMQAFRTELGLRPKSLDEFKYFEGRYSGAAGGAIPLLGVIIRSREDLYPALRAFLKPEQARERA
jgi:sporulation protein YhbH